MDSKVALTSRASIATPDKLTNIMQTPTRPMTASVSQGRYHLSRQQLRAKRLEEEVASRLRQKDEEDTISLNHKLKVLINDLWRVVNASRRATLKEMAVTLGKDGSGPKGLIARIEDIRIRLRTALTDTESTKWLQTYLLCCLVYIEGDVLELWDVNLKSERIRTDGGEISNREIKDEQNESTWELSKIGKKLLKSCLQLTASKETLDMKESDAIGIYKIWLNKIFLLMDSKLKQPIAADRIENIVTSLKSIHQRFYNIKVDCLMEAYRFSLHLPKDNKLTSDCSAMIIEFNTQIRGIMGHDKNAAMSMLRISATIKTLELGVQAKKLFIGELCLIMILSQRFEWAQATDEEIKNLLELCSVICQDSFNKKEMGIIENIKEIFEQAKERQLELGERRKKEVLISSSLTKAFKIHLKRMKDTKDTEKGKESQSSLDKEFEKYTSTTKFIVPSTTTKSGIDNTTSEFYKFVQDKVSYTKPVPVQSFRRKVTQDEMDNIEAKGRWIKRTYCTTEEKEDGTLRESNISNEKRGESSKKIGSKFYFKEGVKRPVLHTARSIARNETDSSGALFRRSVDKDIGQSSNMMRSSRHGPAHNTHSALIMINSFKEDNSNKFFIPTTEEMKKFVKDNLKEANKNFSSGPINITNEVIVDTTNKTLMQRHHVDWKDFKYSMVRARWKKCQKNRYEGPPPEYIDKVIKLSNIDMFTPRPEYPVQKKEGSKEVVLNSVSKETSNKRPESTGSHVKFATDKGDGPKSSQIQLSRSPRNSMKQSERVDSIQGPPGHVPETNEIKVVDEGPLQKLAMSMKPIFTVVKASANFKKKVQKVVNVLKSEKAISSSAMSPKSRKSFVSVMGKKVPMKNHNIDIGPSEQSAGSRVQKPPSKRLSKGQNDHESAMSFHSKESMQEKLSKRFMPIKPASRASRNSKMSAKKSNREPSPSRKFGSSSSSSSIVNSSEHNKDNENEGSPSSKQIRFQISPNLVDLNEIIQEVRAEEAQNPQFLNEIPNPHLVRLPRSKGGNLMKLHEVENESDDKRGASEDSNELRRLQSMTFVRNNSLSRRKVTDRTLGRDSKTKILTITKRMQEDQDYKQFINTFFMGLGFVLASNKHGAFKTLKHFHPQKPSLVSKMRKLNSLEIKSGGNLDTIFANQNRRLTTYVQPKPQISIVPEELKPPAQQQKPANSNLLAVPSPNTLALPNQGSQQSVQNSPKTIKMNAKRRGSYREVPTLGLLASNLFQDFSKKIKPMEFIMRDSLNRHLRLVVEVYLLNDLLNKDKFFVAFKFTDKIKQVWAKSRISLSYEAIDSIPNTSVKEWLIIHKGIQTALPDADLSFKNDLSQAQKQATLANFNINVTDTSAEDRAIIRNVHLSIVTYFMQKLCLSQKYSGKIIAPLTTALKRLATLANYFNERFGRRLINMKEDLVKITPVPWEILQRLNKQLTQPGDIAPIDITHSKLVNQGNYIYSVKGDREIEELSPMEEIMKDKSAPLNSEQSESLSPLLASMSPFTKNLYDLSSEVDNLHFHTPLSPFKKTTRFISTIKAVQKFKGFVKANFGWSKGKYQPRDTVLNIKTKLLTICIKFDNRIWLNVIEIDSRNLKDPSQDLLEEFEIKIFQQAFPLKSERPSVARMNINELPEAIHMSRKNILRFIGGKLCGSSVYKSIFAKFNHCMTEFLKKEINRITIQNKKNNSNSKKTFVHGNLEDNDRRLTSQMMQARAGRMSVSGQMASFLIPELSVKLEALIAKHNKHGIILVKTPPQSNYKPPKPAYLQKDYPDAYVAKTLNLVLHNANEIQNIYFRNTLFANTISARLQIVFADDTNRIIDHANLKIYDFLGQKSLTTRIDSLDKLERLLQIATHQNEVFKTISTNMMFATKKADQVFPTAKSFRREDIYLGNKYSDDPMVVKRTLLFDTYNGYLKTLSRKELTLVTVLERVGQIIIRSETYHNWNSDRFAKERVVFVKFNVIPHGTRLTLHKMVLREKDIYNITNINISEFIDNDKELINTYIKVFKHVMIESKINYSFLLIRMSSLTPDAPYANTQIYKNVANSTQFDETETYLTPVIFSKKTLCKVITRMMGKYVIVTVVKDVYTKAISLSLYFPQLKRELTSYIHANSLPGKVKTESIEKILKKKMDTFHTSLIKPSNVPGGLGSFTNLNHTANVEILTKPTGINRSVLNKTYANTSRSDKLDYQGYVSRINILLEEESKLLNPTKHNYSQVLNVNNLSMMNYADQSYSGAMNTTFDYQHFPVDTSTISQDLGEKYKNQLYWEIVARSFEILPRPHNKQVLSFGQSKNILKEIAFMKEIIIDRHSYCFEVILDNQRPGELFNKFKSDYFQNIKGIYYFFKLKNNTKKFELNCKLSFLKAVELLGGLDLKKESSVNIYLIKHIAFLLCKRIYFGVREYYEKHAGERIDRLPGPLMRFVTEQTDVGITLNNRTCTTLKISEVERFERLYKACLVQNPIILVEILYSWTKKAVTFIVYNSKQRHFQKSTYDIDKIYHFVPFFDQLLQMKLYLQLGERLLASFKNKLIIDYYAEYSFDNMNRADLAAADHCVPASIPHRDRNQYQRLNDTVALDQTLINTKNLFRK